MSIEWKNFGKTAWGAAKLALIGVAWSVARHYSEDLAAYAVYDAVKIRAAVDLVAAGMALDAGSDIPVGVIHKLIKARSGK